MWEAETCFSKMYCFSLSQLSSLSAVIYLLTNGGKKKEARPFCKTETEKDVEDFEDAAFILSHRHILKQIKCQLVGFIAKLD